MANWLSVKSIAEKYGIKEDHIRELIRQRYVSYTIIDDETGKYCEYLIDSDRFDTLLSEAEIESLPDDKTTQRVPTKHLNWLYQEIQELENINNELAKEIYHSTQREEVLEKDLGQFASLVNKMACLYEQMNRNLEHSLDKERKGLWATLHHFFTNLKQQL